MLQIIICDDNNDELNNISSIIKTYLASKNEAGSGCLKHSLHIFNDAYSALDYIQNENRADVAILDIMMPGMNGVELAERLRELGFTGYIVFLTSVNDFAAEAFGARAFDYLLKPATASGVSQLMDRLVSDYLKNDINGFNVKVKTEIRHIRYRELIYTEVSNNNLFFLISGGKTIKAYAPLKEYADIILKDKRMIRANNSYIINIDFIRSFDSQAVIMQDNTRISVTGSFRNFKNDCYKHMFGYG